MIKKILTFATFILSINIIFSIGFHTPNEVLPGTFTGNYEFIGNLEIPSDSSNSQGLWITDSSDSYNPRIKLYDGGINGGIIQMYKENSNQYFLLMDSYSTLDLEQTFTITGNNQGLFRVYHNNTNINNSAPYISFYGGPSQTRIGYIGKAQQSNGDFWIQNEIDGGHIGFKVSNGAGAIEKMTITESGSVGIGTTNPLANLHVGPGQDDSVQFKTMMINQNGAAGLVLRDSLFDIEMFFNSLNGWGGIIGMTTGHDLSFRTSNAERMRILSTGYIGIGNTNPSVALDVEGTIEYDSIQAESDIRLKKNIINNSIGLNEIQLLRPVSFDWRNDTTNKNRTQIGLIAQEVEQIIPEVVITKPDGYKSIAYVDLIMPLINSVKELKKENNELKKRIEVLETK